MPIHYVEDAAAALEDITEAGRAVTLEVQGAAVGTAANPTLGAVTSYDTVALMVPYKEHQIDGTAVIQGDVKALVPAISGVTPKAGDILVDGGKKWSIINPGTLRPGPTEIMHAMQLREVA